MGTSLPVSADTRITGGDEFRNGNKVMGLSDADMDAIVALRNAMGASSRIPYSAVGGVRSDESPGERWKRHLRGMKAYRRSRHPADMAARAAANADMLATRSLSPGDVHNDSTIAEMSVMYANDDYIGTQLVPFVPVSKDGGTYFVYGKRDRLAIPDDTIGADGDVRDVHESRSTASYSCVPKGLKGHIDVHTLANQDAPLDEMLDVAMGVSERMALAQEKRHATLAFTVANHTNTQTIAAANRWDTTSGGTIIANLQLLGRSLWSGAGPGNLIAATSIDVYDVMARNPQILDLFKYNGSSPGLATPDMIARWFMWDRMLIGRAREDTANEGQTASYSRIWADRLGLFRVATFPSIRNASFGYTFIQSNPTLQDSDGRITSQWYDPKKGVKGRYYHKETRVVDEKIVAADTSGIITTPIG